MKRPCEQSPATLEAARSGDLSDNLRTHLEGCEDCRDLVRVHEALDILAREASPRLPDPSQIWQLHQQRSRLEKAVRPIRIAESSAAAAAGAAGLGAVALGPRVWESLEVHRAYELASQLLHPVPLLVAGSCTLLAILVSGIFSSWVEG